MSDPVDTAIAIEHDRQDRAFERAHACMDFCAGMTWDEGLTLAEVADALESIKEALDEDEMQIAWRAAVDILSRLRTEKDKP